MPDYILRWSLSSITKLCLILPLPKWRSRFFPLADIINKNEISTVNKNLDSETDTWPYTV
jgi:hypothetical protein